MRIELLQRHATVVQYGVFWSAPLINNIQVMRIYHDHSLFSRFTIKLWYHLKIFKFSLNWKRTTVEIQYNWWQLSEVIIYHIRALGQYKPLPTTTTEEPTTTTELTTTTTTKTTTRRWG
ncbi:uncharacterized protein [Choristoneura fumiferana]|uniref:uncharacterized protein n=1 Tax=Choristoneura fumiferana TaxID=7141 RepID=UPI003D1546DD